jgi:hypothetical protein
LAGLGAAARSNPNAIYQTVVALGDGTYAVELGGNYYRVDGDLPTSGPFSTTPRFARLGQQGSLWAPIVEKAYTLFRRGLGTYASLNGGGPSEVFRALGQRGLTIQRFDTAYDALTSMSRDLQLGKAVTIATNVTLSKGSSLVENHVYIVEQVHFIRINIGSFNLNIPFSVTVRNPWGRDGGNSNDGIDDGRVTVTGQELLNSIQDITSAWV